MVHKLIAYYSRKGENYTSGIIRNLTCGYTEMLARYIQQLTQADCFKIEPCVPYSEDYCRCIDQARQDQRRDARPELLYWPKDIETYDAIFLGYPNYWGTMPMPVFTFLEHVDLSGKSIHPFCTHEGGGLGRSEQDIQRLCPRAIVKPGLAIRGGHVSHEMPLVQDWLEQFIQECP